MKFSMRYVLLDNVLSLINLDVAISITDHLKRIAIIVKRDESCLFDYRLGLYFPNV